MRRDEEQELREQRQSLVKELRDHASASDTFQVDNDLTEWRAEDKDKFAQLEQAILKTNSRLEMQKRTESLATWAPEDAVSYSQDGAPKTLRGVPHVEPGAAAVGSAGHADGDLQVPRQRQGIPRP